MTEPVWRPEPNRRPAKVFFWTRQGLSLEEIDARIAAAVDQRVIDIQAGAVSWNLVTGKPTEFPPASHNQPIGTITGLQDVLNSLTARIAALEQVAGTPTAPSGEQILLWNGTTYGTYDSTKLIHRFIDGPNPATLGYSPSSNDIWEPADIPPPAVANLVTIGAQSHVLDGTDITRGSGQLIRYTRTATQTVTPTNQFGVEVVVSLTNGQVLSVNPRIQSGSTAGTTIPDGTYVLSGHGGPGGEEAGNWLLTYATVGAVVALSTGTPPPPDPTPPVNPGTPGSGLGAKVLSIWHHRWSGPSLRNWPSDVQAYCNSVSSGLAQSGGSGTGTLSYAPLNGQSVADHATDIRAFVARGCNVLLGFGGSSDGGISITTDTTADQAYNSIVGYVSTYGFSGIDIDLEPSGSNWTQSALLRLCSRLKTQFGSGFVIGVTAGLYDVWTARWTQFMVAAGNDADFIAPMLYDFPEAGDSRLTSVSIQKCDAIVAAGIPQSKIILGYMMRPNAGYLNSTPNVQLVKDAWAGAKAKYPNLRGVFVWEDLIESQNAWWFTRGMGPIIGAASAATGTIATFTATAASTTAINLAWSYSGTALTNFTLQRNGVTIASPAAGATTYGDTGLAAGTTYNYTLTANYSAGGNVSRSVQGTTSTTTPPAGATWLSGASGEGVATGAFATWRGEPVPVASSWSDSNAAQVEVWPLQSGLEYGAWTGSLDLAIGAIDATETWANAAAGSYDARWTTALNRAKTEWTRIARTGTLYLRFAHEWNGSWMPWSVTAANITNFINAWRRFRNLQTTIFPAAKLVFCPNSGTSGQAYDWRTAWPGDTYVDVCGVDWYSFAWSDGRAVDQYGGPVSLEQHRQFALAHGKPLSVPEWGVAFDQTGDVPTYIQYMRDYFKANAGTGAGNVLYECYFNVIWTPNNFGLYPRAQSLSPNSSDRYVSLSWGT